MVQKKWSKSVPRKRYSLIPQKTKYCLLSSLFVQLFRVMTFIQGPVESMGLLANRCSTHCYPPQAESCSDLWGRNSRHQNKSEPQKLIKRLFSSWHGNHNRTRFRHRWLSLFLSVLSLFSLCVESLSLSPSHSPCFAFQIFLSSCQHLSSRGPARQDPRTTATVTWGPQRELDRPMTRSGTVTQIQWPHEAQGRRPVLRQNKPLTALSRNQAFKIGIIDTLVACCCCYRSHFDQPSSYSRHFGKYADSRLMRRSNPLRVLSIFWSTLKDTWYLNVLQSCQSLNLVWSEIVNFFRFTWS